ncbi:MAG: bifunctional 4-hydroxy-2-oxoglutarate aldolase/2-dehydro-3-deoxy-phosphogluconate aldolase [Verrucomicrobiota bacterium]
MIEPIRAAGIVPVVVIDRVADAVPLAEVLLEHNLCVIEITCRTSGALDAIEKIASACPDMTVGAGTVLTAADALRASNAGAQFAVAPGCSPEVIRAARQADLLFAPGVMTPSDVEAACALGCTLLKFFPAGAAGGPKMLKALHGPYSHLGLEFIPTGGISAENLASYLELPGVAAVGGSWMVKRELIVDHDWDEIGRRIDEAVKIVAGCRRQ